MEIIANLSRDPSRSGIQFRQARDIVARLQEAGFEAWFVGGVVRDILLGRELTEIDITTNASVQEVKKLFKRTVPVGEAFGVVRVMVGRSSFEVASYRREAGHSDGRHPDRVYAGTMAEDVKRRDFTINGLVLDPKTAEILDLVGGVEDIKRRVVRAIGTPAVRMKEDYLRTLRAVRFSAVLGFSLDKDTRAAVEEAAPGLARISRERVKAELEKICRHNAAPASLRLICETGLFPYIFPFLPNPPAKTEGVEIEKLLESAGPLDMPLLLGLLTAWCRGELIFPGPGHLAFDAKLPRSLSALAKEQAKSLRLSVMERKSLLEALYLLTSIGQAPGLRLARRVDLYRSRYFPQAAAALKVLLVRVGQDPSAIDKMIAERAAMPQCRLHPPRLITGHDIASCGVPEGPIYGELLRKVSDLFVEGKLSSREEALSWLYHAVGGSKGRCK